MKLRHSPLFILALALICASVPYTATAQAPFERPADPRDRIQVTLVFTASGQPPMLLRRPGDDARNVVLLDSAHLDAQQLSDAVFQLLVLEAQDPGGQRRAPNTAQRVRADVPHPVYPWAEEAIRRLRAEPARSVPGVTGDRRARTLHLWMRPLRGITR
jgi:hypothetical protein